MAKGREGVQAKKDLCNPRRADLDHFPFFLMTDVTPVSESEGKLYWWACYSLVCFRQQILKAKPLRKWSHGARSYQLIRHPSELTCISAFLFHPA